MAKTLVLYDELGNIVFVTRGNTIKNKYFIAIDEIDESKQIKSVDTNSGKIVIEDSNTRIDDIQNYLNSADDITISKIEDTILEVELNKTLDEEDKQ